MTEYPVRTEGADAPSPRPAARDHASNRVPDEYPVRTPVPPAPDMARHNDDAHRAAPATPPPAEHGSDRQGDELIEDPVRTEGVDRPSRWLVTCDHASNRVPDEFPGGSLGLSESDMARHIAWDPGALGVARAIAGRLDAPCVWATYSRLVIDPNRGEDDPTLVMRLCDGTAVPANRGVDDREIERRLETYHRPYHKRVSALASRRNDTIYVSIHTFTRRFRNGSTRPWEIGLLFADDRRLADPLGDILARRGVRVGMNEPYTGDLKGDAVDRHATSAGLPNVLIEVRNDLVSTPAEQEDWGHRLTEALEESAERADL